MLLRVVLAVVLSGWVGVARGDVVLRMATIAPDGTHWAREIKALARDVEAQTGGAVRMKWYFGGIAGDELVTLDRVKRGQLDGMVGASFCPRVAPSLWVSRVIGLMRDSNEHHLLLQRLQPTINAEAEQNGFAMLSLFSFGPEILLSRAPLRTFADLRKGRVWAWGLDDVLVQQLPAMGVPTVPLPVEEAGRAYDDGRVDGFVTFPMSALAFQFHSRARYALPLSVAFLTGCMVVARRALDALPVEQRKAVQSAGAKFGVLVEDGNARQAATVVDLLDRQGVHKQVVTAELVRDFERAALEARRAIKPALVPVELLQKSEAWLRDSRAQAARR